MEELSIEQKAKAYDEAIKKAESLYKVSEPMSGCNVIIETLFPELKESEDERIRKWIIGILSTYEHDRDLRNAAIAYLEKQGEQKPTNKVEPKFKVGDWISGYYTNYKVLSVNNDGYLVEDVDGNKINILFENEKFHHLFTIADAKDGDVLAAKTTIGYPNPFIAIYKEHGLNFFNSHCFVSLDGEFHEGTTGHSISDIHPATKEQCDFLFQKMKEAGYELDDEKKELKKIEQNLAELSEEDKSMFDFAIRAIALCRQYAINNQIKGYSKLSDTPKRYEELQDWLKSLRPQNRWKPSKEQIKVCKEVYADILSAKGFDLGTVNSELNRLEEQLKKLREG